MHENNQRGWSRKAGLAMAYKLIEASSSRWKALYGRRLVRAVHEGARFVDGIQVKDEMERDAA